MFTADYKSLKLSFNEFHEVSGKEEMPQYGQTAASFVLSTWSAAPQFVHFAATIDKEAENRDLLELHRGSECSKDTSKIGIAYGVVNHADSYLPEKILMCVVFTLPSFTTETENIPVFWNALCVPWDGLRSN